mmetsp:Transcript_33657/g.61691  ORF Transcript_33657/g.61691 Transcript_33657/m.61691 type:complete len:131 (-) Transcript_33657:169-561(-)
MDIRKLEPRVLHPYPAVEVAQLRKPPNLDNVLAPRPLEGPAAAAAVEPFLKKPSVVLLLPPTALLARREDPVARSLADEPVLREALKDCPVCKPAGVDGLSPSKILARLDARSILASSVRLCRICWTDSS